MMSLLEQLSLYWATSECQQERPEFGRLHSTCTCIVEVKTIQYIHVHVHAYTCTCVHVDRREELCVLYCMFLTFFPLYFKLFYGSF